MSNRERKSIFYYWSIRYFAILFLSIAIFGLLTLYIFYRNALSDQDNRLASMARDLAALAAANGGKLPEVPNTARFLDDLAEPHGLESKPIMFILDRDGRIVQQFPPSPPEELDQIANRLSEVMSPGTHILHLDAEPDQDPFTVGIHPITIESAKTGFALYVVPRKNVLDGVLAFRYPSVFLLVTFLLAGWGVVFILTRRLIKPIREAADAAKQIVAGNYNLHLDKAYKEKEIYELTHSFKEMADRLGRLEALRTQLLAGVTHEFKTPVTSISGLVQAVREKVVTGTEAEVFLDHCMNECNRLQKMVEDLLDFNSFASGTINVTNEPIDLRAAITTMVDRWRCVQERLTIEVSMEAARSEKHQRVCTDPTRLEQILINLLNNARDAMPVGGSIVVGLTSDSGRHRIRIRDTGCGIPAEEIKDVFEPFYRGAEKKSLVHGLGLGLPFSRMIARSLGGELVLETSSPSGTTFALILPAS